MSTNPMVPQGTLNRVRGSVIIPNFPNLNVTAPFLGPAGISATPSGEGTVYLPTLTGAVTSPEPYQLMEITLNLLRTVALAQLFRTQYETNSVLGDITVVPDATTLANYTYNNCAIRNIPRELSFAGNDAGYVVTLGGIYYINNAMWNIA
jgi:hypothetical protein